MGYLTDLSNWAMRRALSVNRDAASDIFKAPNDGRKWTISALAYARDEQEAVTWIDAAFWPGHCEEAYLATMIGRPLETTTPRAKKGAVTVIWWLLTRKLPKPKAANQTKAIKT